jgi:hypothetical protein
MPSGGLVANHNRNQCITSTLGGRKFTVNTLLESAGEPHASRLPPPQLQLLSPGPRVAPSVRDSPEGPLKQMSESRLKPAKKPKLNASCLSAHTGHGPRRGGPRVPPRRPTQRSPRAGSASLEGTQLPRAGSAPLEGTRFPRAGPTALKGTRLPRAGSASLEGVPHAHAPSRTLVRAFNALTTAGRNPSPLLWGTVRHGRCQPRDATPPTPVRLTCRALKGGPATPSKCFPVVLQGQVVTLGRRDAIPATVNCRRTPPRVQPHAGHCGKSSGTVRHAGTGRRHACHCTSYGSSSATPSRPPGDVTANHCAPTLEDTTIRVQDTP